MKTSITIVKILCAILILFAEATTGQSHYIEKYPGIPIIAHTNRSAQDINNDNLQSMRELGVMGFYATDLDSQNYGRITGQGLKVFPYQIWTAENYIVYYTDAVYTKWEAEGKGNGSDGDMELKYNSSIGTKFTEGDTSGIRTINSTPGKLIYGPWYYQYKEYKELSIDTSKIINYTANYRLKIKEKIPVHQMPQSYLDSIVCKISVTATHPVRVVRDTAIYHRELKVSDFLPPNGIGWNQWSIFSFEDYTLDGLEMATEQQLKQMYHSNETDTTFTTNWMQYKVEWAGRTFLDLYVDYIEISDLKARDLKTDSLIAFNLKDLVNDYADTTYVLGWFGLNEPVSIDNFEPFRIVDSLVQSVNSNLHLYTTYATGWGGIYGMPWPDRFEDNGWVYRGTEFIKRSKLPIGSINNYMYIELRNEKTFYVK